MSAEQLIQIWIVRVDLALCRALPWFIAAILAGLPAIITILRKKE